MIITQPKIRALRKRKIGVLAPDRRVFPTD